MPSRRQTRFANRVHWAKSYLKQAGLVQTTKYGHFTITDRGRKALSERETGLDLAYLEQFEEFKEFQNRTRKENDTGTGSETVSETDTPDEIIREACEKIKVALSGEILDRVRNSSPEFFEGLIVELLHAMQYGGSSGSAGQTLGKSGDGGVDGVINQDTLGVDQIYIQAKRYQADNTVGPSAIRDFFGALNLKKAQKGIFVTTSSFSKSAIQTAQNLGTRIVLIDGKQLANLMFQHNIGCRNEEVLYIKKIDEDFFG